MPEPINKTGRIVARVSPEIAARIDRAARLCGKRMGEYVRDTMAAQARRDLLRKGKKCSSRS